MAGQLIQVDTETVTSAVGLVNLTGIDSDDVYMVAINNCSPTTAFAKLRARVTLLGGGADSSANYDRAYKKLRSDTTFQNDSNTNATYAEISSEIGTATGENNNQILYLYNFNSTTEYAFATNECVLGVSSITAGFQGGWVFTSTGTARDGIQLFMHTGNIDVGSQFTLYKVI